MVEAREASNDPLFYLNSRPSPPSHGFGVIEDMEDRNDPLVSFFASSDPAVSLDQILIEGVENVGAEGLQDYLNLGDNDLSIYNDIDTTDSIDTTEDSFTIETPRDIAIQEEFVYPVETVAGGTYLVSLNGCLYLPQELLPGETSPSPTTTTTTTPSPPSTPPPAMSPTVSTGGTRRNGSKRKFREPDTPERSPSPTKISKATEWRKGQNKEIEKNDQLLNDYEAKVKDQEMCILSGESYLAGLCRQKPFDFQSKMFFFQEQKSDINTGKLKLGSIGKAQKKAEYKKAQVELVESYQAYINTLAEEILAVNMKINTFPKD